MVDAMPGGAPSEPEEIIAHDKCPHCGSTHLSYEIAARALRCADCRNTVPALPVGDRFGAPEDIATLTGRHTSSGAMRILDTSAQVTIACQGCGAEVSVDTDESLEARCHWCRQRLSINDQIPNGAVPDGILPFRVSKEEAMAKVNEFTAKRRFFAQRRFREEFTAENVFGVYLPHIVADARFTGRLEGSAEEHIRSYEVKTGDDSSTTYYDFDEYHLVRELAVLADDITLEASSKRQIDTALNTNNVINAVQPYPIEEAVEFRAHYLSGYNAERRDMDMSLLDQRLADSMLTVLREKADASAQRYSRRGVRWEYEKAELLGTHEAAVYLPLWLYSYVERNALPANHEGSRDLIHYIAVNGITGKTMGSIPVNKGKLCGFSALIAAAVTIPSSIAALGLLL